MSDVRQWTGVGTTVLGVTCVVAALWIGFDWTPLRGGAQIGATVATLAVGGGLVAHGWRALREIHAPR